MPRGGARLGSGRPRRSRWLEDISAVRADRQAKPLTATELARLADLQTAYDFVKATLVRLRAIPAPTVPLLDGLTASQSESCFLRRGSDIRPPRHLPLAEELKAGPVIQERTQVARSQFNLPSARRARSGLPRPRPSRQRPVLVTQG